MTIKLLSRTKSRPPTLPKGVGCAKRKGSVTPEGFPSFSAEGVVALRYVWPDG